MLHTIQSAIVDNEMNQELGLDTMEAPWTWEDVKALGLKLAGVTHDWINEYTMSYRCGPMDPRYTRYYEVCDQWPHLIP